MISKYLHFVSSTKSQIIIFILLNICGLIFLFLPHNIFSNMLDLEFFYNQDTVVKYFNAMGSDGRSVYVLSSLLLDTLYPILYTSLILGAYVKLFKNSRAILFLPLIAFSFDILENIQITMLNLNFPNINETHVNLSSMATSAKWVAIAITIFVLIYGIIKKRQK
tara:strand:+ start:888 stop:1382 length:495 start_codon:yes stop_codon:yes gene_type:complete